MTDKLVTAVQAYLHPLERVKIAIEAGLPDKKLKRYLAVVTNETGKSKEAAIFVFKGDSKSLLLETAIPICGNFIYRKGENFEGAEKDARILKLPLPDSDDALTVSIFDQWQRKEFTRELDAATNEAAAARTDSRLGNSHEWLLSYQLYSDTSSTSSQDDSNRNYRAGVNSDEYSADDVIEYEWVAAELKQREPEYTTVAPLNVFCGTWNVNGRLPVESLKGWLCQGKVAPDIYAIGLQEVDTSAGAFLANETDKCALWMCHIEAALFPGFVYRKVRTKQLVGIMLFVYVKEELLRHVHDVDDSYVGVGVMNIMGNKGGVGVRLRVHNSTFCFISSHLAAFMEMVERRNQDFSEIMRRMDFAPTTDRGPHERGPRWRKMIHHHDFVFWLGDLNYRIRMDNDLARQLIRDKNYVKLRCEDQLLQERAAGKVFQGFHEMSIDFAPTYKFDVGTHEYDSSEKNRVPAWTDRILWRTGSVARSPDVKEVAYSSHPELITSDHKPTRIIIENKLDEVYQSILRENDRVKNNALPDAKVDANSVDFGDARFMLPITRQVTIENVGLLPLRWRFVPKLDEPDVHRPWLEISPMSGSLMPGLTQEITFTLRVDNRSASALNDGAEKLEDILVLHLEKGKDIFIVVAAKWLKSPFGASIDELVLAKQPVRPSEAWLKRRENEDRADQMRKMVPLELWRLVDWLLQNGLDEPGLLLEEGIPSEMARLQECLATGDPFDDTGLSVHSVANTLLDFLAALAQPVVPYSFTRIVLEVANKNPEQCKLILDKLPPNHYQAFMYILNFAFSALQHKDKNDLTPERLAVVLGDVMIQVHRLQGKRDRMFERGRYTFMYNIITMFMPPQ